MLVESYISAELDGKDVAMRCQKVYGLQGIVIKLENDEGEIILEFGIDEHEFIKTAEIFTLIKFPE